MKRTDMVVEGAKLLIAAERSADAAYVDTTLLACSLVRMRLENGVSAVVGQEVVNDVSAAIQRFGEARAALVRAHAGLNAVKTRMGCATVATGGEDKHDHDGFAPGPFEVVEGRRKVAA